MKSIAKQLNVTDFPFRIKDSDSNEIYYEDSDGNWRKSEYDSKSNQIYYENSDGTIIDNLPKEVILTMDEIADKFGINVKDLKVRK